MLVRIFIALIFMIQPALAAMQNAVHHEVQVRLFPAKGTMEVNDMLSLTGRGRIALALDARFVIEDLSVDGRSQSPTRSGNTLVITLGRAGSHRIALRQSAQISGNGGVVDGNWLAQPLIPSRASYRITVTTPPGQISVVDGKLKTEANTPKGYTATFTATARTVPMLFTGPYTIAERIAGGVRIRTYFHPELRALAPAYLNATAKYIAYYSKKIGPYPYAGFAIVSGNDPVGWGLPAMTYISRRVLGLPFILTTSLPHEILHNWWGNAVGVDDTSGNWAEGLTTYQADYGQMPKSAPDGKRGKRLAWLRNYAALPSVRDFALDTFVSKTSDASQVVGYGKAAFVFHMLKVRLGANVFKRALRLFFTDNLHRNASWGDIQSAFETVSGENLDAFFKAWITRAGAPQLELKTPRAKDRAVTFTLTQTQSGKAYRVSIPVVVDTVAGQQRTVIAMDRKTQSFTINVTAKPLRLRIDPDFDVFRRLPRGETPPILRNVTLNAATVLFNATPDETTQNLVRKLVRSLTQNKVIEVSTLPSSGPFIIVGKQVDVRARLKGMGLSSLPGSLRNPAQAKAFVIRIGTRTVLAVMVRDQVGLKAMTRALTHDKDRSFVIINAGRVTAKGTWPMGPGTLTARLK